MISTVTSLAALRPRACLPRIWHELPALAAVAAGEGGVGGHTSSDGPLGPVILVPGLLAGDGSLARMRTCLHALGHPVHGTGINYNVDCSELAVGRLLARVADVARLRGERVTLIGHSRGGLFARVAAQRRPDLVAGVVALGAPHRDPLAVHPLLWAHIMTLAALRLAGVRGVLGVGCAVGVCCEDFRRDLAAPVPEGVGLMSVYSRRDGVVDWRACMDGRGENVLVHATHCAMALDAPTLAAVADAARRFRDAPPTALAA